jgi:hypothetical protein
VDLVNFRAGVIFNQVTMLLRVWRLKTAGVAPQLVLDCWIAHAKLFWIEPKSVFKLSSQEDAWTGAVFDRRGDWLGT